MRLDSNPTEKSFVLFALGSKRFALPAESVAELVGPCDLHVFRHTSPLLLGVLVHRGRIVPVWDVARLLSGASILLRRFHLIARQPFGDSREWIALPVTGDCEIMAGLEPFPASSEHPPYVAGLLILVEEMVEILDLEKLAAAMPGTAPEPSEAAEQPASAEVRE